MTSDNLIGFQTLYTLWAESLDQSFDGRKLQLTVVNQEEAYNQLNEKYNTAYIEDDKIEIVLVNDEIKIFYDKNTFLKDFNDEDLSKDFAIIKYSNESFIFYSHDDQKKYGQNLNKEIVELTEDLLIENTCYYSKILDLMKEKLAIYHASANREIVIAFIPIQEPIFCIGYPSIKTEIPDCSLKKIYTRLESDLQKKDFIGFIKIQICKLLDVFDKEKRYVEFLRNFEKILDLAELDFEIYLRNFSFEEVRNKFRESKEKYLQSIQEQNNKLYSRAGALVVSVSASVFASFKFNSDSNSIGASLILFVYVLYSIYCCLEFASLKDDISILQEDLREDLKVFKEKLPKAADILINDSSKLESKIVKTKDRLMILYSFIALSNLSVFVLISLQTGWYCSGNLRYYRRYGCFKGHYLKNARSIIAGAIFTCDYFLGAGLSSFSLHDLD
ncbi:hypothetical protein [Pseudanabaena sp. PCC 6802]|uniref:hypothetical protein n=1 Tax=Pseudanabaena sp. PCC 6802 TaxID=118173 RepID=UPI00034D9041|nr:hypothetical protein [Pseudanabaena sp. PCC 6802]